jgi:hypothetical protein
MRMLRLVPLTPTPANRRAGEGGKNKPPHFRHLWKEVMTRKGKFLTSHVAEFKFEYGFCL